MGGNLYSGSKCMRGDPFHGHNITWQLMYPYERCFPARYFQLGIIPPDRNIFEFDRKKFVTDVK
jgi:hypothetical protein